MLFTMAKAGTQRGKKQESVATRFGQDESLNNPGVLFAFGGGSAGNLFSDVLREHTRILSVWRANRSYSNSAYRLVNEFRALVSSVNKV